MPKTAVQTDDVMVVYVRLLDEGTDVWRAASARRTAEGDYVLQDCDERLRQRENWEIPPGERCIIERGALSGEACLLAIRKPRA